MLSVIKITPCRRFADLAIKLPLKVLKFCSGVYAVCRIFQNVLLYVCGNALSEILSLRKYAIGLILTSVIRIYLAIIT